MRVYSLDGSLQSRIVFDDINYKILVPGNYEWSNFTGKSDNKKARIYPFRFLFRAFQINEHGIFLGIYHEDLIVDHYDLEGNFLRRFIKKHKDEPYYLFDFLVKVSNETYKFYILNWEGKGAGIPKVDVFQYRYEID